MKDFTKGVYEELKEEELEKINGGFLPLIPVGALFVASAMLGYNFGKDLANRKK
ncbi:MAG: class IIb bacteriocin, lactobin A/cerein 7B family [Streptococcaceae bacterium]|nr:class IIb bacteriocin, lactobin A/cerein 7B family [Streptococcaceae bacterium]